MGADPDAVLLRQPHGPVHHRRVRRVNPQATFASVMRGMMLASSPQQ
jgi:hypothetical protein